MIFEELHALEGSGAADEFVAEFGLVVGAVVVDLLVAVSGIVWSLLAESSLSSLHRKLA
jgi:hypothetical protein